MATDAAVSKEGLFIPLIDFSKFLGGTAAERAATAKAMLDGFQTAGFIYLKNHEVAAAQVRDTFSRSADFFDQPLGRLLRPAARPTSSTSRSADFFDQPLDAKLKLGWTTPEANRGYSSPGREKVTQLLDASEVDKVRSEVPDLKESFEIGRESDPFHRNPWPRDEGKLAGFRAHMVDFFDRCQKMHRDVMTAIALGMGLDEHYFDGFIDDADNSLRLLHYPEVKADVFRVNPGQVRAGEHSVGALTVTRGGGGGNEADARRTTAPSRSSSRTTGGGLQVRSPNGQFVDATPIEGTVVVNAGDLLARWSNDTIRSTLHRVVEPPRREAVEYPPRYSIVYFCNPNPTSVIETLPGTYAAEQDKKYGPVKSGEYLVQRLAATY